MKQETRELINELKDSKQDFEFYPTTKEMISCIFNHIDDNYINVLDIGCGTCNFKNFYDELAEEKYNNEFEIKKKQFYIDKPENKDYEFTGNYSGYSVSSKRKIDKYYVIEKSKILLDRLHKDIIVLGTNFHESLLIDKPVQSIFCNPPYSEFKEWMIRIINEGNCNNIYFIVPDRWKNDNDLNSLLQRKELKPEILGSFDFLNAEREARAKVDVLYIKKKEERYHRNNLDNIEETAFDEWFNETFKMQDSKIEEELHSYEKENKEKQTIKNKLIECNPKNKAKTLVMLYNEELTTLFDNFKAICVLDLEVLETIGVSKKSIKEAIKQKTINLKNIYWELVFDEVEEITSKLTSKTRADMLEKFKELKTVEFNEMNIYSLIVWVIKNANSYYDDQLITFYKDLSSSQNVKPYKSNIKTFDNDNWRFSDNHSHYTLDYRIICSNHLLGIDVDSWNGKLKTSYKYNSKLKDFKVIFNNLGFKIYRVDEVQEFGKKYYAYDFDGMVLFEFKAFKNGNIHFKFNVEFTKALNVEVARLLGWIRCKEDIKKEFDEEMSEGAEKYFKVNHKLLMNGFTNMQLEFKNEVKE